MSILGFPSVLILLIFILLSVNSQRVTLANAVSSNTGEYEETIFLEISPWSGLLGLGFMFANVSGPFDTSDIASDPSFLGSMVLGTYSPDDNRTVIMISLNTSEIASVSQGRLKADMLKTKLENFFNISLPYTGNSTYGDTVQYFYRIDECPVIQRFGNIFLEHRPSDGFGEIVTPDLLENYVAISFNLIRKGNLLEWWISATINYPEHFEMDIGKEYTVSLKDLTGYSETIQASSESSNSILHISISQVDKEYKLESLETAPDMEKRQGTYGAVTTFMFEKTITSSSVDDLSIRFKIVSPRSVDQYSDQTTIAVVVGIVVVAIVGIAVNRKGSFRFARFSLCYLSLFLSSSSTCFFQASSSVSLLQQGSYHSKPYEVL